MPLRSEGERKDTADTQIIVPHLFFFKKSQFVKMRNLEKYKWVSGCCEQNVLPKLCLW